MLRSKVNSFKYTRKYEFIASVFVWLSIALPLKGFANDAPPVATIDYPAVNTHYNAGDVVYYGATATDSTGVGLLPSAYTWQVDFHYNTQVLPFITPTSGKTAGFFTIPTQGESSNNTWYEITLTVTSSSGLKTQVVRDIYPNTSLLTFNTSPSGLTVTLDGQTVSTPNCAQGVVGFVRSLGVASPQTLNGVSYEFSSWADGATQTHDITTSVNHKTYTAIFKPVQSTRTGKIAATPNPALVCDGSGAGSTTLNWTSSGTTAVEVHINAPNGDLLVAGATGDGSLTTGKWVGDGSTFYLQDVSGGLPLTQENTLAIVTVTLTNYGCNAFK